MGPVLEWVNHASFVFRDGDASLMCDPWLSGPAFNNGWELLSPSRFAPGDFANITHIWFSHEHPDHFSPPNLRSIPDEFRRRITVLYHETRDRRVLNLCKSWGFQTQEMSPGKPIHISSRTRLTVGLNDLIDSWLAIRCHDQLILNLNDCIFKKPAELEQIRRQHGQPDVLLTQFSYANWVGNPGDRAAHRRHAHKKLAQICQQIEVFRPKWFIPFASYVVFAHEENFHFNREINHIEDVHRFATATLQVPTVVLYPGDCWELGAPHDASSALGRYQDDYRAAMLRGPVYKPKPVPFAKLQAAQENYFRKTSAKNRALVLGMIPRAAAHLRDLGITVGISFRDGLKVTGRPPDIVLSADSLEYAYSYDWGGDTLAVNGRYEVPEGGNPERFFWNFRPGMYNATGHRLGYRFVLSQVAKRLRNKLGTEHK